ncbi:MAG: hypothetical protein FJW35_06695 [Acidobacteria bacterium]|nr:hypothetical protein [Acidobacteriota bacterium]
MKISLKSDFPVDDAACRARTGKTMSEWFAAIDARGGAGAGRRETINWLYEQMNKDVWWPTTVWVEFERARGIVNKKDGLAEGYNICVTKTIAAPVAEVYRAFTDPAAGQWLGLAAPAAEGTAYSDDGGNSGTWLRLRPGKDVRLKWQTAGVNTATQVDGMFADKGKGKTGITLNHQRIQTREEADGLREAWAAAFERLKARLEA